MTSSELAVRNYVNRRAFIGGSDARIIMGADEAALVRLWREKRGEAGMARVRRPRFTPLALIFSQASVRSW